MRIAVVSTDGESVDEHFGKATRFLIYEVNGGLQTLVTEREVEPLSTGDPSHPFDADRLNAFVKPILDCDKVYCVKIGERPELELRKVGITAVVGQRPIADICE